MLKYSQKTRSIPGGLSLLEILAAITITAIMALLILPRLTSGATAAKKNGCEANRRNIETQVRLWYRSKGTWPAANLGDIGTNTDYLPAGVPICPVDGSAYTLDATTHQITGHSH